jgi:hypothetical protein
LKLWAHGFTDHRTGRGSDVPYPGVASEERIPVLNRTMVDGMAPAVQPLVQALGGSSCWRPVLNKPLATAPRHLRRRVRTLPSQPLGPGRRRARSPAEVTP